MLLLNALRLILLILSLPLRVLGRRKRPAFVRFLLRHNPPYLAKANRRRLFRGRSDPAEVRSVEELKKQLEILSRDRSVRGVLVVVEELRISQAKRKALEELFQAARVGGKQVVGYGTHASGPEFELLCAADRIILAPGGRLELTGFSAEATALGSALRRLGIEAHFVRRGEHKTAPELFTEPAVSQVQRQTIEHFLDDQYEVLVAAVSRGRRLDPSDARRKVDEGPYSARRALAEGLCDQLCPETDLSSGLAPSPRVAAGTSNEGEIRIAPFVEYAGSHWVPPSLFKPLKRPPRLAVVPLDGIIIDGDGGAPLPGLVLAAANRIRENIRAAARDARAEALLLSVGSPGGSAIASESILEEVRAANKKKPVLAYFDRVAASGGYLAALGAREIWSAPHAIVGSIGVFAGKFEFSALFERLGIHRQVLTRGRNAGLFSISRSFTESERRALEAEVEDTYQSFLEQVAQARGMTKEEAHARGEGRVFPGHEAMQARLVDRTGSFDGACRRALELAGKATERYEVILHAGRGRPLTALTLLRRFSSMRLFALWYPFLQWDGL